MKKTTLIFVLALIFLTVNAQNIPFKKFSFLIGHWELKTKSGKITEHWKSNSKSYLGTSYTYNTKGDSTLTETIVLKEVNGTWEFIVTGHEKGNTGTTHFKLITAKDNTFRFENADHDFPQRIVYQAKGNDNLLAWIEGKMGGKDQKIEFAYHRKK